MSANQPRAECAPLGGWPIGTPLPLLMTPADLRQVFQISESYYFEMKAAGRFRRFEAPSVIGPVRYSGDKVRSFLLNEPTHARTFGAPRGPRRVSVSFGHEETLRAERLDGTCKSSAGGAR